MSRSPGLVGRRIVAACRLDVKFSEQVTPRSKLVTYRVDVKRVVSRQITLGIGDGLMRVDGEIAYEAENLKVTLFSTEE